MPVTQRDLDWVAARLLPDIYDIRQRDKFDRNTRRLKNLLREVDTPEMNIRLRELANWREKQHETPLPEAPVLVPANPTPQRAPSMSITGLTSGAFQAKLDEIRKRIADEQTKGLTQIDTAVTAGAAQMDAAVKDVTTKVQTEISDALQEFAQFTNGPQT
jgi:hypothetical protein